MPFQSKAQRGYMFAHHPQMAKEWAKHTDFSNLPEHVDDDKEKRKARLRALEGLQS